MQIIDCLAVRSEEIRSRKYTTEIAIHRSEYGRWRVTIKRSWGPSPTDNDVAGYMLVIGSAMELDAAVKDACSAANTVGVDPANYIQPLSCAQANANDAADKADNETIVEQLQNQTPR